MRCKPMVQNLCWWITWRRRGDLALQLQTEGKGKVLDQFNNQDNANAHFLTTGPEIWQQSQGKNHSLCL